MGKVTETELLIRQAKGVCFSLLINLNIDYKVQMHIFHSLLILYVCVCECVFLTLEESFWLLFGGALTVHSSSCLLAHRELFSLLLSEVHCLSWLWCSQSHTNQLWKFSYVQQRQARHRMSCQYLPQQGHDAPCWRQGLGRHSPGQRCLYVLLRQLVIGVRCRLR